MLIVYTEYIMAKGRQARTLRKDQIERLEEFRRASHEGALHGYSLPQLRSAMGAGFGWRTLQKALQGRPVWDLSYFYIAQWIERFLPAGKPVHDGKAAAAGDSPEPEEDSNAEAETGTTRTVRGSR